MRRVEGRELGLVRPVRMHDPQVGAHPAVARRADRDRMAAPGMEQDPVALRADRRDAVGVRPLRVRPGAGQALEPGAVEVRDVDLVAVALLEVLPEQDLSAVRHEDRRLTERIRVSRDVERRRRVVDSRNRLPRTDDGERQQNGKTCKPPAHQSSNAAGSRNLP